MPINVFDYLSHLEQERYRTIILHTPPEKSPSLTQFCQKICQRTNGKYLDLLDFFILSKPLSESIDQIQSRAIQKFAD